MKRINKSTSISTSVVAGILSLILLLQIIMPSVLLAQDLDNPDAFSDAQDVVSDPAEGAGSDEPSAANDVAPVEDAESNDASALADDEATETFEASIESHDALDDSATDSIEPSAEDTTDASETAVDESTDVTSTKTRGSAFEIIDGVLVAWTKPDDFYGDVQIPEGVLEIADHVFQRQAIDTVTLPDTLVKIGKYAFAYNAIKTVVLPDSVEEIDDYAFVDKKITELKTNKVKTIGESAFQNNELTALTLELVETLGKHAFYRNDLVSVVIPDTFQTMGQGVFSDNNRYVKLTGHTNGLEAELDGDEYGYVVNVVTLVVRYLDHETNAEIISTKTLGTDLSKLGEIYVQNVEATYTAPRINAYRALEETIAFIPTSASYELKVLYQSLKKPPVIEAPMKNFPYDSTIDAEALLQDVKATDLDGTDISDQLTVTPESLDGTQPGTYDVTYSVEDQHGNIATKTVSVAVAIDWPEMAVGGGWKVGDFAFARNGFSLDWETDLDNEHGHVVIGFSDQGLDKLAAGNTQVYFPPVNYSGEPVTAIGEAAFAGSSYWGSVDVLGTLTTVHLPDSIQTIGASAFYGQRNLTSFVGHGVTTMAAMSNEFWENYSYTNYNGTWERYVSYGEYEDFPLEGAFFYTPLASVSMPALVGIYQDRAFAWTALTDIDFPNLRILQSNEPFLSNFYPISMIASRIYLPRLEVIHGDSVFHNAYHVQDLTLTSLREIKGNNTFKQIGVYNPPENPILELHLPSLETIEGDYTFAELWTDVFDMPALRSIKGNYNFAAAELGNMPDELYFPSLVTIEGSGLFYGYSSNTFTIYGKKGEPTLARENWVFNPTEAETALGIDFDDDDFTWANDTTINGLTEKGYQKLVQNDGVLNLPDSVKDIADYTFYGSDVLKSITSSAIENLTGKRVFYGSSVESITLNSLKTITDSELLYASQLLTSISLPALETINADRVFGGWFMEGLKELHVPSLTTINGNNTFFRSGIDYLYLPALTTINGTKNFESAFCNTISAPLLSTLNGKQNFYATQCVVVSLPALETLNQEATFEKARIDELDMPSLTSIDCDIAFRTLLQLVFICLRWRRLMGMKSLLPAICTLFIRP